MTCAWYRIECVTCGGHESGVSPDECAFRMAGHSETCAGLRPLDGSTT